VVGVDEAARELRSVLAECEIEDALVADSTRPTTSKTRIVAMHQQVVRVDEEDTHPLGEALAAEVMLAFERRRPQCQGVVLSDYAKGFLTPDILSRVIDAAAKAGVQTFVDPKGPDYERYRGCSLLKPNRLELALLTHMPVRNHEETLAAGRKLAAWMPGTAILVTEGTDGMTLFGSNGFGTDAREQQAAPILKQVFDVTGAGDTVLATVALALSSGGTVPQALQLATHAASLAVGVIGTAAVTRVELAAALSPGRS
jgi:D-beta-D-heptose 7-phosphate kinase/D-beta-D-heptose 1-phosphate adenosyltransferase